MADETINDKIGNPFGKPEKKESAIGRRLKDLGAGLAGLFSGSKAEPKPSPSPSGETVGERLGYPGSK